MGTIINLIGKRFGKLFVVDKSKKRIKSGNVYWTCHCKCGKYIEVIGANLRRGNTSSCGCGLFSPNKFDLTHEFGIGYCSNGTKFLFDLEDYEKIKNYKWQVGSKGYIVAGCENERKNKSTIRLHRLIMNAPKDKQVDHKFGNVLDNRKENLRIATPQQNSMNQKKRKTNKSGYSGVSYIKETGKWRASLYFKRKHISLGYYKTKEEAIQARIRGEEKFFGEFKRPEEFK